MSGAPLLEVDDLKVAFRTEDGLVHAVSGVSFEVNAGEVLAVVGESGCGKSVTAMSLMGLIRGPNTAITGTARLGETELIAASDEELRRVRGEKLAMIFQDPMTSLNPVYRVGDQIAEQILAHRDISKQDAADRVVELLAAVGIPAPEQRARDYPRQFSGGMRQRAMIAMGLSLEPPVLIADEPTTALDVTIQAQILRLLKQLNKERGLAVILITHDLGVVADIADRLLVMYAGRVVETGTLAEIFYDPQHPYTWGLLGSIARLDRPPAERLAQIMGQPPSLLSPPVGCHFRTRCPHAFNRCSDTPPLEQRGHSVSHLDRCWLPGEERAGAAGASFGRHRTRGTGGKTAGFAALLEVRNLVKHFPIKSGILVDRQIGAVRAVDGVSFTVGESETVGLVGESGCGKSTLARSILQLIPPTSGSVRFRGTELTDLGHRDLRSLRREMQMIFQDPYASLNPRKRVGEIVGRQLKLHELASGAELKRRVCELLERVGLSAEHVNRYPHEFSGGQRQRIGVARALALEPKLIIADEPVSALDVSIQAQIVNLLRDLQDELGLTYLFVAHDLGVVRHVSDRIAVMYLGKIVEIGPAEEVYANPIHPYTLSLISAVPIPDPQENAAREQIVLEGEVPSPASPPTACRFHTRCPQATEMCSAIEPQLVDYGGGHWAACHHPLTRLKNDRRSLERPI